MQKMTIPPLQARALTDDERIAVVVRVDELLELKYRSRVLGNLKDPLAEAVYTLLSRQTHEAAYQRVYAELRARWPEWQQLLDADVSEIESVIAPAGFGRQRAMQLKELLHTVAAACADRGLAGEITLSWLAGLDDDAVESFLLSLPGIGPKSARYVMHYALGRPAFAVDTNVKRIFHRLGLVTDSGGKVNHALYEQIVPKRLRQRLHVNLIHHGREVCRSAKPNCASCPLISFCETGRTADWSHDPRPVAVELFAGGGGMGAGFTKAGYRLAVAVEWDRDAAQTYRANHPGTVVLEADVRKVTGDTLRRLVPSAAQPQVIVAGPPCQGYSAAGKREATDEKNSLFLEVTRLARELKPRFVVIENVPGMRKVGGVSFTQAVLDELERSGYDSEEYSLRACDFGVPQLRHRLIFMAQRNDLGPAPDAPDPSHCAGHYCERRCGEAPGSRCGRRPTPTVLDTLKGLPELGPGEEAEYREIDGFLLLNGSTMRHSDRVIEKIRAITPGTGPISYRRLHPDIARTIVAGHRALPVHPILHRTISVREAARIQGFDDDHVFCGPRANQPLQVANAVPPPLAEAIAKHLKQAAERDAPVSTIRRRAPRSGAQTSLPVDLEDAPIPA
ncbi:DNA (cytosine-5-)-methyltransferase [Carbonactinospora thermoautotrophica]|nr:DNA (cytosine-5-)-methyltransferase [Carbonactinospora thermoautotrophica]